MDPTPAPPGTARRKIEGVVLALAVGVGVVSLAAIVYWFGAAFGLWPNIGFGPEWVGGD